MTLSQPPASYPETRRRLDAAVLTLPVIVASDRAGVMTLWPPYRHEFSDWWESTLDDVRAGLWRTPRVPMRFQPTHRDIDDCLYALSWLNPAPGVAALARWERAALHRRAWQELIAAHAGPRTSWLDLARYVAEEWGVSYRQTWWRNWRNDLIARAFECATSTGRFQKPLRECAISGQNCDSIGGARVTRGRAA